MARGSSLFVCQQCGYESGKWMGKCLQCGEWNSMVETVVLTKRESRRTGEYKRGKAKEPIQLASVAAKNTLRTSTKISELDRVLGGGIVPGQVVLVAGEPGIGKSTILLQLAETLGNALYISGEESVNQLKIRADRLGVNKKTIQIMEETDIDQVVQVGKVDKVKVIIIDSIQTMATSDLSGMAGSVGQVRECAYRLVRMAKSTNIPVFIVGHVTKQGSVAGPAVLAHLVDTVLWFEGDKSMTLRMLRAMKNRFGPTDEVGIFSMEDKGLVSVTDSSKLFLTKLRKQVAGSCVAAVMHGTRSILIEIQSLIIPTKLAFPRRIAQGIDSKRLEMLLAVLTRRCSLSMYDFDVFVNVTGGINLRSDPSADLAICLSIASAFYEKALPRNSVAVGEVGLLGDVREVIGQEKRIKEAKRLGYKDTISNREAKYLGEAIKAYINIK